MARNILFASALVALLSLSAIAQTGARPPIQIPIQQVGRLQVGTEEPCILNQCLFYAGDFDPNGPNPNGLWNQVANFSGLTIDGTVWVPFTVPKKFKGAKGKTDWAVSGLFVNLQNYPSVSATEATWSIVQGVTAGGSTTGGQVKVICSGTSGVTTTPTGRVAFGLYVEQTYVVTGITGCGNDKTGTNLEAGTYWLTLVPQVSAPPDGFEYNYMSDVEDNSPSNIQGPGTEPIDQSYFTSAFFGLSNFTATNSASVCGSVGCDEFSAGVIGTAVH